MVASFGTGWSLINLWKFPRINLLTAPGLVIGCGRLVDKDWDGTVGALFVLVGLGVPVFPVCPFTTAILPFCPVLPVLPVLPPPLPTLWN